MSADFHFNISGQILIDGVVDAMDIYPENFVNVIRICDYVNKNMPMILVRVNLDKNLIDLIVKNAKTATFHLRIGKFSRYPDSEARMIGDMVYIEDDFDIITVDDINYHKELDYMDTGASTLPIRDRYKQTYLGLVSKACVDTNKVMENIVIQDSTMQNIVLSYLTHTHLLIEPFDHNEEISQLIIPPTDTLTSLIKYLNSIKVFYNTKYLFFIDEPYCTYLLSRSGAGVGMRGEDYDQVNILLRAVDDVQGLSIGMGVDAINEAYVVDVSVLDSRYTVDNDTAKIVNQLNIIVNPSNDNDQNKGEDVINIKNTINRIQSQFQESLDNYSKMMDNQAEKINSYAVAIDGEIKDNMQNLLEFQDKLIDAVVDHAFAIPTAVDVKIGPHSVAKFNIMGNAIKKEAKNFMKKKFNVSGVALKGANKICSSLKNIVSKSVPQTYKMDYSDNHTSCLTYVNLQETINTTIGNISILPSGISNAMSTFSSSVLGNLSKISSFASGISNITGKGDVLKTILKARQAWSYYGKFCGQYPGANDHLQKVIDNVVKMHQCVSEVSESVNTVHKTLDEFNSNMNVVTDIAKGISRFQSSLSSISGIDVSSKFVSNQVTNNFALTLDTVSKTANKISKNVQTALKDINFKALKKLSLGSLNLSDIVDIKMNLSAYDIDKIGRLGLSSFESELNIGTDISRKRGSKIIKVRNDNPNEIKNIKSELETMINQLSINKFGLDPSVFTPNKRYIVSNYAGHGEQNGLFVLNSKVEVYIREDDTFVCNTRLDLSKVPLDKIDNKVTML